MASLSAPFVIIAILLYIIVLFWVAKKGDKEQFKQPSWTRHPLVYVLALGVYCTSWTFFGLVGSASRSGWDFLPILLGPMLLFTIGLPVIRKIFHICKQEHIHSIADFIASRYGKRQTVAAMATVVVLLATIPYIALQLKAVSNGLQVILGGGFMVPKDLVIITAISMTVFALLFGAKRLDMSGYHSGIMTVLAFESIVKIVVLALIALFSLGVYFQSANLPIVETGNNLLMEQPHWPRFIVNTLLSMCALLCLPRMFHITFVECQDPRHLESARWLFPLYLGLISCFVFIIAWVGNSLFAATPDVSGDTYLIALPLANNAELLSLLAFIGGFSAATAMIIIATITLSQMLSNDVILPLFLKRKKYQGITQDFSRNLIIIRRLTVIAVVTAAYLYQVVLAENAALNSIGLVAFALAVQLFPGIIFGIYWSKGNVKGFYAGMSAGMLIWFYALILPLLADAGVISEQLINYPFLRNEWESARFIFGLAVDDRFTFSVILSLLANIAFYIFYSLTYSESLIDKIQASAFTRFKKSSSEFDLYEDINLDNLHTLLQEFIGEKATEALFKPYRKTKDKKQLLEHAQKSLAGIVGVASSQAILKSLQDKNIAMEDVFSLMGDTTKALKFNQDILFSTFDSIVSGISVVNNELQLVAWNRRYEELFKYPDDFLHIGLHVVDIMRFNGQRGLLEGSDMEEEIQKRTHYMSMGKPYRFIRKQNEELVIEIKGTPLANGGYVTVYNDISEFITTQEQLKRANENLESRVAKRTQEIEEINHNLLQEIKQKEIIAEELAKAKKEAEQANISKTKFLALAGHDIMQPLNAASLYISALQFSNKKDPNIINQLSDSIQSTESIITALLEIAKIDNGSLKPKLRKFSLLEILKPLVDDARILCDKSIDIRLVETSLYVYSDKHYLRRILQNFISNAIKYTVTGKILVGCRRRRLEDNSLQAEITVLDTGPGINDQEKSLIFQDFYRTESVKSKNVDGLGLGLSVVSRFSEILDYPVNCVSVPGKGSAFSVCVPADIEQSKPVITAETQVRSSFSNQHHLNIACLDDEVKNLTAISTLLKQWHCPTVTFDNHEAFNQYVIEHIADIDVLIIDYQLGVDTIDGLEVAKLIQSQLPPSCQLNICLVSAAPDLGIPEKTRKLGIDFLKKPIKPAKLNALLTNYGNKKLMHSTADQPLSEAEDKIITEEANQDKF